jgi:hypothetical protein
MLPEFGVQSIPGRRKKPSEETERALRSCSQGTQPGLRLFREAREQQGHNVASQPISTARHHDARKIHLARIGGGLHGNRHFGPNRNGRIGAKLDPVLPNPNRPRWKVELSSVIGGAGLLKQVLVGYFACAHMTKPDYHTKNEGQRGFPI